MAKFEVFIDELINHQTRVIVEADNVDQVNDAIEITDDEFNRSGTFASDYVSILEENIKVISVDEEYSEDVKEVECNDFNKLLEEEM